ncbi:hypothetical protein ACXOL9_004729 [Vibrio parahaemolyticus]
MIRSIDKDGNIYGSRFVNGLEQVTQTLECQLQLFLKENPYDLEEGIDWPAEINGDRARLSALIRNRILTVDKVTGIDGEILMRVEKRILHVSAVVHTEYGITALETELNG